MMKIRGRKNPSLAEMEKGANVETSVHEGKTRFYFICYTGKARLCWKGEPAQFNKADFDMSNVIQKPCITTLGLVLNLSFV